MLLVSLLLTRIMWTWLSTVPNASIYRLVEGGGGTAILLEVVTVISVYLLSVSLTGSRWTGMLAAFVMVGLWFLVPETSGQGAPDLSVLSALLSMWFVARWYESGQQVWLAAALFMFSVAQVSGPFRVADGIVFGLLLYRGAGRHNYMIRVDGRSRVLRIVRGLAFVTFVSLVVGALEEVAFQSGEKDAHTVRNAIFLCTCGVLSLSGGWAMVRGEFRFANGIMLVAVGGAALQSVWTSQEAPLVASIAYTAVCFAVATTSAFRNTERWRG